jgi:ribosomal protein S12 methylthiotransferase
VKARVGFISLGCPKNQLDCELMMSRAVDAELEIVYELARADVIVVNTCAFIREAQAEADEAIREALACKLRGTCRAVVVAGCLPQYLQQQRHVRYPDVDAWLTPDNPGDLPGVVEALLAPRTGLARTVREEEAGMYPLPTFLASAAEGRVLTTPPSLAYVKIAEGCNHRCAFCIVPRLRGAYRSRPIDDVLTEVRGLVAAGVPEIVLVSQDSSRYGSDLPQQVGLAELLRQICTISGDGWLRVMYLHPEHVTSELLGTWADLAPRLLPYFDVPVQHVSEQLLRRMGRRGNRRQFDALFRAIREACPGAVIRTSLIVGYPGESEAQFNELYSWVASGAVDRLGVFTYSDLPELRSHGLPHHVDEPAKAERQDMLMQAQLDVVESRNAGLIGSEFEVMLEEAAAAHQSAVSERCAYWGRTWREAYEIDGLVHVYSDIELPLYKRVSAVITGVEGHDLEAEATR